MVFSLRILRGLTARPLAGDDVAASHGEYIWASLQRFGVRERDLADVAQEVLVVVHRHLPDYDPQRPLRPWLYGICLRVALGHRRRAWVRREVPVENVPDAADDLDPERAAEARQDREGLIALLRAPCPDAFESLAEDTVHPLVVYADLLALGEERARGGARTRRAQPRIAGARRVKLSLSAEQLRALHDLRVALPGRMRRSKRHRRDARGRRRRATPRRATPRRATAG